jgi:SAM-dependent methyltransferase
MNGQRHTSDSSILDRRTLARDHRRLGALLRPGMHVLDVGCGTGAITADVARAVGPTGRVVGQDRDPALLARARARGADVPWLSFEEGDVLARESGPRFDVVTAARLLQWIERPDLALARMAAATRPGGQVVVLDYDHTAIAWDPEPAGPITRFYAAFLAWRAAHGWDNAIAVHLSKLFADAGLEEVASHVEDEVAERGAPGFEDALDIWRRVLDEIGGLVVEEGFLESAAHAAARTAWGAWAAGSARRQHMVLRAVVGRVPALR